MTLHLTYSNFSNPNFLSGMRKLAAHNGFKEPKAIYNCSRLVTLLEQELKTYAKVKATLRSRLKGYTPESEEAPTEADKAKLEEFRDASEKFLAIEVTIKRHKVDFDDLAGIALTPAELIALEPILTNLPLD